MDITKLSVVELKALAFDLSVEGSRIQQNLQVVQQEIAKRLEKKEEVKVEEHKKD